MSNKLINVLPAMKRALYKAPAKGVVLAAAGLFGAITLAALERNLEGFATILAGVGGLLWGAQGKSKGSKPPALPPSSGEASPAE